MQADSMRWAHVRTLVLSQYGDARTVSRVPVHTKMQVPAQIDTDFNLVHASRRGSAGACLSSGAVSLASVSRCALPCPWVLSSILLAMVHAGAQASCPPYRAEQAQAVSRGKHSFRCNESQTRPPLHNTHTHTHTHTHEHISTPLHSLTMQHTVCYSSGKKSTKATNQRENTRMRARSHYANTSHACSFPLRIHPACVLVHTTHTPRMRARSHYAYTSHTPTRGWDRSLQDVCVGTHQEQAPVDVELRRWWELAQAPGNCCTASLHGFVKPGVPIQRCPVCMNGKAVTTTKGGKPSTSTPRQSMGASIE